MHISVNGATYHVEVAAAGPPLVLLHGFTGSVATWSPFLADFGQRSTTIAIDLLGHGSSDAPADPARYRMERCVDDLWQIADRLGLEQINLLGYSMGGRVALHLAAAAPERINVLILESASPGIPDAEGRAARIQSDSALAELLDRQGLAAFVDHWERLPLFASQQSVTEATRAALRRQRLDGNPRGFANSLRGMGTGTMEPLFDRLATMHWPTLLVVGALDAKYRALGQAMADAMPTADLHIVPNAGHTVHLEQPEEFARAVLHFLEGQKDRWSRVLAPRSIDPSAL